MHGRLKVKTTAQQEEEKAEERTKRVRSYQHVMGLIFKMRKEQKLDEEMLKITANVLVGGNPDITTLWNIRKEVLLLLLAQGENDSQTKLLVKELEITQQCLMTNPKSYGAWHHRCWCLKKMPNPDWDREISICNKYLSLDERNFHCWDYRHFVVKEAKIGAREELDYTMERINVNFSNYSAWHYRSKLLPLCYPNANSACGSLSEEKRRDEIGLIQNAAFTDPDDSSAWFYHTWLLDMGAKKVEILSMDLDLSQDKLQVVFSKQIDYKLFQVSVGDKVCDNLDWKSLTDNDKYSEIWMCQNLPKEFLEKTNVIKVSMKNDPTISLSASTSSNGAMFIRNKCMDQRQEELDEETRSVIEEDLKNCQELLELEPDSKWTRLSMVLVMQALGENKYLGDIVKSLQHLETVDPMRKRFFEHLGDSFLFRSVSLNEGADFSKLGLSAISHPSWLTNVVVLNLSGNNLKHSGFIQFLLKCIELNLADNKFEVISNLEKAPMLKKVLLQGNPGFLTQEKQVELKNNYPSINIAF